MRNKGITLIALVVTIIVILILSGISLSILTGNNGILSKTQEAKEKTAEAQNIEIISMALYEKQIDDNFNSNENKRTLENYISEPI